MLLPYLIFISLSLKTISLSSESLASLDKHIKKVVECHGLAGLTLAVVQDGTTLFQRGYGSSDLETQAPVTPDTLYAIGSVSKQFTSFLLEYYQEHGLLDLELPIALQLKRVNEKFRITAGSENERINLHDLLSHRTGLPTYMGLEFLGNNTREQLFHDLFYTEQDMRDEYRGSWHYNNWLYVAAARAGEIMSGRTFEEDIQNLIYDNLSMGSGTLSDTDFVEKNLERIAKPYFYYSGKNRFVGDKMWLKTWNPAMTPAGGLLASGSDMAKWMIFLLSDGILNTRRGLVQPTTIRNMFHKLNNYNYWSKTFPRWSSSCTGYGEGWFLYTCPLDDGKPEYGHSGNFYNVHYSKISLYPHKSLGVFYAFSGGNADLNGKLFGVLDTIILDTILRGSLHPKRLMAVNVELEQWGCPSKSTSLHLHKEGPAVAQHHHPIGAAAEQRHPIGAAAEQRHPMGGPVLYHETESWITHPVLSEYYLGVYRHPFLGKAEIRHDELGIPRLVLNDQWTARIYEKKANHDTDSGDDQRKQSRLFHCFFDNIPWLPQNFMDDVYNEMLIEIAEPTSPDSTVTRIAITKWWINNNLGVVVFNRVGE